MKKLLFLLVFCSLIFSVQAQKDKSGKTALVPDKWEFQPEKVEFTKIDGVPIMKILPMAGKVVMKALNFSTGAIELDLKPQGGAFAFLYFRYKDADENESIYFRTARAGKPMAPDAVQYAPHLGGVLLWDVLGHYQTNASFSKDEWNHVKLEVSETQMRLYVNNEAEPTLEVPRLEGNTTSGTLAFEGEMLISNLSISPKEVKGLSAKPGIDPTAHDPRYLRFWKVSTPIATPEKVDFSYSFMPNDSTQWDIMEAERRGLVNLSRKFGKSESRRLVWLKLVLKADKAQQRKIDFGFSDEAWVFLNGRLAFLDKNPYNQPLMKAPDGRISVENSSFNLSLIEGYNELLVGVANDFYGWGIMARLDQLEGIEVIHDEDNYYYGRKVASISETVLQRYVGNYKQPDGKAFTIAKAEKALKVSGDELPTFVFYPESERKFFLKEHDVQMELIEDSARNLSTVRFYESGNQVLELELQKQ